MTEYPFSPGEVLGGKFRIDEILGQGGMGVVVAAWHLELEQRVAIKFLLPQVAQHAASAERFRREARAAVKIQSQHVGRVFDVGTLEDGIPFMVMEYLEGCDLADVLTERGRLPAEEAVDYVLQACEAIAEAHGAGIIHRDLKPANLFLAKRSSGIEMIKVLDFGISKSVAPGSSDYSLTGTSSMMGSPQYMSPEQLRSSRDVDAGADIWSLGVILFELTTGQPPFQAETMPQLCTAILETEPPSLESEGVTNPELDAVIRRCLCKNRQERFASIAELGAALTPLAPSHTAVSAARMSRLMAHSSGDIPVTTGAPVTSQGGAAHGAAGPLATSRTELGSNPDLSGSGSTPQFTAPSPAQSAGPMSQSADSTVNSWGHTERPAGEGGRGRLWVGLAAVLALGAMGLVVALGGPGAAEGPGAAGAGELSVQAEQAGAESSESPAARERDESGGEPPSEGPEGRNAGETEASGGASGTAGTEATAGKGGSSTAVAPKQPPHRATPRPAIVSPSPKRPKRPVAQKPPTKHPPKKPAKPASVIDDFGGRE